MFKIDLNVFANGYGAYKIRLSSSTPKFLFSVFQNTDNGDHSFTHVITKARLCNSGALIALAIELAALRSVPMPAIHIPGASSAIDPSNTRFLPEAGPGRRDCYHTFGPSPPAWAASLRGLVLCSMRSGLCA